VGIQPQGAVATPPDLPTGANNGNVYYVQSNGHLYVYQQGMGWVDMGFMTGPPGPPGAQGVQGPAGATGAAGAPGQAQTPWLNDEDAVSHNLNNVSAIGIREPAQPNAAGIVANMTAAANGYGLYTVNNNTSGIAGIGLQSDNNNVTLIAYGSTSAHPGTTQLLVNSGDLFFSLQNAFYALYVKGGSGYVGIGVSSPSHLLELSADSAAKPSTSTWQITSDARTKQHAHPLEGGLAVIDRIEPIEAEYNGAAGTTPGARVVSVDPAKVREVLPHTVTSRRAMLGGEETDVLSFNPHELLFHLILAVQQLGQRLAAVEAA